MARKQHHEEHTNHEAWAIPYGDLITLLLAFFVVMYAVSSVNEGKYRVLAESLQSAFNGGPRSLSPVQVGQPLRSTTSGSQSGQDPVHSKPPDDGRVVGDVGSQGSADGAGRGGGLRQMAEQLEAALDDLIQAQAVTITRPGQYVEVEIRSELLFPTGSASIDADAEAVLRRLAAVLRPLPNTIRVEGHTDNRPISNARFPSNWELSAARAARIVRAFEAAGIAPQRMVVAGMGEYHPVADNSTPEGRRRNRRVTLVILDPLQDPAAASGAAAPPMEGDP
ncbi:MAG: flagellar motor protein MotD [Gammaproteobacteria bacterium]|nr:MAG: flagellar motor protein MotD [Gammaproteobacteria bacterium]